MELHGFNQFQLLSSSHACSWKTLEMVFALKMIKLSMQNINKGLQLGISTNDVSKKLPFHQAQSKKLNTVFHASANFEIFDYFASIKCFILFRMHIKA